MKTLTGDAGKKVGSASLQGVGRTNRVCFNARKRGTNLVVSRPLPLPLSTHCRYTHPRLCRLKNSKLSRDRAIRFSPLTTHVQLHRNCVMGRTSAITGRLLVHKRLSRPTLAMNKLTRVVLCRRVIKRAVMLAGQHGRF